MKKLPKLRRHVDGNKDFMRAIKYLKYYPKTMFQLPSGLSIYKSWFKTQIAPEVLLASHIKFLQE